MKNKINNYFIDKKINAEVEREEVTHNFTTYFIKLNDITKLNRFNTNMIKELSYILNTNIEITTDKSIKIIVNNNERTTKTSEKLKILIGKTTDNKDLSISFDDEVHVLIAGTTGSGKSVFLNNCINELVKHYNNKIEFCFIDLKKVEFYKYNALNTNIDNVANDIDSALLMLDGVINLMNERYNKYVASDVLKIDEYNKNLPEEQQDRHLFVIIDELAELMLMDKKGVQTRLQRILQLGRASGIHVISATQRPSADVLAGTLKVNFTTSICFKVRNMYDSKTILNQKGAELLNGNGDGYILKNGSCELIRFQGLAPCNDEGLNNNKTARVLPKYTHIKTNYKKIIKWIIITILAIIILSMIGFSSLILITLNIILWLIAGVIWFMVLIKKAIRR